MAADNADNMIYRKVRSDRNMQILLSIADYIDHTIKNIITIRGKSDYFELIYDWNYFVFIPRIRFEDMAFVSKCNIVFVKFPECTEDSQCGGSMPICFGDTNTCVGNNPLYYRKCIIILLKLKLYKFISFCWLELFIFQLIFLECLNNTNCGEEFPICNGNVCSK